MRVSPVRVLQVMGTAYVNIVRNTPLTLVIVFCNLGLSLQLGEPGRPGVADVVVDNIFRLSVLGLSAYHAAFVAEAIRSGVDADRRPGEAARALGLPLPQDAAVTSSCRRPSAARSRRWATRSSR